jgi:ribosome-binding ATPase YchF (GTP1/OBG family)
MRGFPSASLGAPPDPAREAVALEDELVLADLEVVERRLARLGPALKRKPTEAEQRELTVLSRVRGPLEEGVSLRAQPLAADEGRLLRGYGLLSLKPILHCLNLAEADVARREELLGPLAEVAKRPATAVGWVSALVEAEVAALPADEQRSFLDALGLPEPALHRVLRDAYVLLGLVSFFTVGEDEVRAWTIPAGATALEAAAVVHSDIARGFIRAEVIGWAELVEAGSLAEARRRGVLRLEGKEYRVRDGEICHFRFNVGR